VAPIVGNLALAAQVQQDVRRLDVAVQLSAAVDEGQGGEDAKGHACEEALVDARARPLRGALDVFERAAVHELEDEAERVGGWVDEGIKEVNDEPAPRARGGVRPRRRAGPGGHGLEEAVLDSGREGGGALEAVEGSELEDHLPSASIVVDTHSFNRNHNPRRRVQSALHAAAGAAAQLVEGHKLAPQRRRVELLGALWLPRRGSYDVQGPLSGPSPATRWQVPRGKTRTEWQGPLDKNPVARSP